MGMFFNEKFVSESENSDTVKTVFTILGFSILAIFISIILYWAYNTKDGYDNGKNIFNSIYSFIFLTYCCIILTLTVINKEIYDSTTYILILGLTIFMMFLTFFLGMFFILNKYVFNSYSSYKNQSYYNNRYG
jgi:hypothetical protein